jgi:PleD family two-component response regulator
MSEKKTILVIDDEIPILTAIQKILTGHFEVCLAKSAEIAVSILNSVPVDLILLDVEMPDVSGLEFMDYLRNNLAFHYIPVIFVTSHGTSDIIIKAKKSGAKDFVVKPVTQALLERVNAALVPPMFEKTLREQTVIDLHLLELACKAGDRAKTEALAEKLSHIRYNGGSTAQIDDIRQCVKKQNYAAAIEKIEVMFKSNLYDKK